MSHYCEELCGRGQVTGPPRAQNLLLWNRDEPGCPSPRPPISSHPQSWPAFKEAFPHQMIAAQTPSGPALPSSSQHSLSPFPDWFFSIAVNTAVTFDSLVCFLSVSRRTVQALWAEPVLRSGSPGFRMTMPGMGLYTSQRCAAGRS